MTLKKSNVIGGIILLFLLIVIGVILYNIIGPGSKEIKASKNFISKLYSINAISTEQNPDSIKYEKSRMVNNTNENVYKSIVTKSFGIDLDKNNNVVGFAKKEIQLNSTKINIQDAKVLAEKYLKQIYDGDVVLKNINDNEDANRLPYYSFIYTKEENGYPFYFDEIKLNIDKEDGFLDGYSNSTVDKKCKDIVIDISEKKAEDIALESFEKYNKEGNIKDKTTLVYTDNKMDKNADKQYELSYLVTIEGKNDKDGNLVWKFFVSSEDGEILSVLKDGAEKKVITN